MKKLVHSALVALALAIPAFADEWTIDASHTNAGFAVRHMMVSTTRGAFGKVSGTVSYDGKSVASIAIDVTIDASTIDTGNADRDKHLRSADFFDVEKFPTITFKSKKTEAAGEGKFKTTGDLTIHGVTKEVVLEGEGPTPAVKNPWGATVAGATATTKIKRSDFGLTWNKAIEAGGIAVGDEVSITIDVEVVKVEPKPAGAKPAK